jgi:hypothetical protein
VSGALARLRFSRSASGVTAPTEHAATEEKEASKGDQVGVHDPRERLFREDEMSTNRRKRDADDRQVEDDHQIAETEDESASQRLSLTAMRLPASTAS